MSWWSTIQATGSALGVLKPVARPVGCSLGRTIYRETRRATTIANVRRKARPLTPTTQAILRRLFPDLDVGAIRVRDGCRLPPNRFDLDGDILAMTFGTNIFWAGPLDESKPRDLVNLFHEVVHVDQVRRLGGQDGFACAYGTGYVRGGGEVPASIRTPTAYHRNPLEAEAYRFEAQFQDEAGRVRPERIPRP
ncbi:MAG: hypothetical protein ABW195_07440 [Ilumatobacteraceae bacterium]